MREILFRGKREDSGEWMYGDLIKNLIYDGREKEIRIGDIYFERNGDIHGTAVREVIPETVGQFTGLCDKNGNKIFEGDIIHIKCGYGFSAFVGKGIVFFDEKRLQFRVKSVKPSSFDSEKGNVYDECDFTVIDSYEVIGNIYENPELLGDMK